MISFEYRYINHCVGLGGELRLTGLNCVECDGLIAVPADAIRGEIVSCRDCGASYELERDPGSELFTLRTAELEEEDWGE